MSAYNFGFLYPIFNFIFGSIVGSFLNVVIYRVPRSKSIVKPPSHCPSCGTRLKWYDMIPVLSYLILKGKCRYCHSNISIKYPLIEAITGLVFLLIGMKTGWSIKFVSYIIFSSFLIVVAFIDLFDGVVPDIIVIPGAILGLLFNLFYGKNPFLQSLFGVVAAAIFFGLIIVFSKGGMGEGDLTLGLMIGAFLGLKLTVAAIIIAFVIGALGGLFALLFLKKNKKDTIPFGPYLSVSAFVVLLYGYQILNFYFKMINF